MSGKCYIGFQVKIPEEFKEREDDFLDQLTEYLKDSGTPIHFVRDGDKPIKLCFYQIFTGKYEFTEQPKDTWGKVD